MNIRLTNPLSTLPRCPQCGAARPTLNLREVVYHSHHGTKGVGDPVKGWAIYQCTSCEDVVVFEAMLPLDVKVGGISLRLNSSFDAVPLSVLPASSDTFDDWPDRAANYMRQAIEALGAPDGVVMLAGSAVDSLLKEKGYQDGSVYTRIETAVKDTVLTEAMGKWAHSVRLSANAPRHADLEAPHASRKEALSALEFTRALAQFLFVLPARIERGKAAAEQAQAGGTA